MPLDTHRHLAFWSAQEVDRPLVSFHIGPYYPLARYRTLASALPAGRLTASDLKVEAILQDYALLQGTYADVDDDSLFIASPLYGFPWMEAYLGCAVRASVEADSFWADPFLADWSGLDALSGRFCTEWLDRLSELMVAMVTQAGGAYPVSLPSLRSISDMMAAARGGHQFALDCIDYPEETQQLANVCLQAWLGVIAQVEPLVPRYDGGFGARDYGLWAPEQVVITQEDASALLSPRLFGRYILPHHRTILNQFRYSVLHLHPPSTYVLDQVLDLADLSAIELNYELGGPDLETMMAVWQRIQQHKPLVIYGHLGDGVLERVVAALDPRGLALHPVVPDADQARTQMQVVKRAAEQRAHLGGRGSLEKP